MVKFGAMDSYIMIQMMATYMQVAPTTTITFDLYGKLCNISSKFKELFNKGQEETPQPAYAATGSAPAAPVSAPTVQTVGLRSVFCGQCGTKNEAGTKFCGSCGSKL